MALSREEVQEVMNQMIFILTDEETLEMIAEDLELQTEIVNVYNLSFDVAEVDGRLPSPEVNSRCIIRGEF